MRKASLVRFETGPLGTYGLWTSDSGYQCYVLERRWAGNKPEVSCILPGPDDKPITYRVDWTKGENPKHGECYEVRKVKDRTDILIHAANWAGDPDEGWFAELFGCLAPGRAVLEMVPPKTGKKQKGVSSSKDALAGLIADMEKESFDLTVSWRKE